MTASDTSADTEPGTASGDDRHAHPAGDGIVLGGHVADAAMARLERIRAKRSSADIDHVLKELSRALRILADTWLVRADARCQEILAEMALADSMEEIDFLMDLLRVRVEDRLAVLGAASDTAAGPTARPPVAGSRRSRLRL